MKTYEEKQQELEDRTIVFSVNIINTCGKYADDTKLKSLINQIIRSATSVGANYAEANNSSSRADFKNKIYIAKKEIAETRYWLKVLSKLLVNHDFSPLEQEAKELNLILQKIISTIKSKESPNNAK
ncbi:MAG: hypothetical protein QG659_529 [Patescibacteria group bacterium]|jgi:four helix bundle protein|nr:hypothetical protein [Patescibacteria group bacterium]